VGGKGAEIFSAHGVCSAHGGTHPLGLADTPCAFAEPCPLSIFEGNQAGEVRSAQSAKVGFYVPQVAANLIPIGVI